MNNTTRNILISAVGLALVGGVVYAANQNTQAAPVITIDTTGTPAQETGGTQTPATTPADTGATGGTTAAVSSYKDGTYSATGKYQTPESTESVSVTLTLKDGIVTDANVSFGPTGAHESGRYQQMFAANYKQYVVGKDIATLKLTRVSGSSLTPMGFNAAVAQIKTQAAA